MKNYVIVIATLISLAFNAQASSEMECSIYAKGQQKIISFSEADLANGKISELLDYKFIISLGGNSFNATVTKLDGAPIASTSAALKVDDTKNSFGFLQVFHGDVFINIACGNKE